MKLSRPLALWWLAINLILITGSLGATHIIGGEMTYVCQGVADGDPNTMRYEITLTVYRDCALDGTANRGGGFDSDATDPGGARYVSEGHVSIYLGSSNQEFLNVRLTQPNIIRIEPDLGNPCLIVPPGVCVQRGIYTFTVDLPLSPQAYTITYQRCCRNPTISNIIDPNEVGATYFITITPEAQQVCNSSPVFDNFPPIVLCANEYFELPMAATDAEGDRLVYYLCSPVEGGGRDSGSTLTTYDDISPDPDAPPPYNPVLFRAPDFTAQRPLGLDANFIYNDSTGLLSGEPTLQGQFVVGICIDEFRGDTLLSSTKREFQFNVTFCSQAVSADLREDSITPDGRFLLDICGPGDFTIFNESSEERFIDQYNWYVDDGEGGQITGTARDLSLTLDEVGTYAGIMILNESTQFTNCQDSAEFFINVYPDLRADFEFEYDECVAGPVQFTDLSEADDPGGIRAWNWDFADGQGSSRLEDPAYRYRIPGDFPVSLTITDGNRCQASQTLNVPYFPAPPILVVAPSRSNICVPEEVFFNNLSTPIDETYGLDWEFGDGGTSTEISPTHNYETPGIYDVYLGVTSPIGCFIDTVFQRIVTAQPSPTAGFGFTPEEPNNLQNVVDFFDQSIDAIAWKYDIGNIFNTSLRDFSFEFRDTGRFEVIQVVTHPSGCTDTLIREVDIQPVVAFNAPNAFTPNGDGLNDVFVPKTIIFGIREYSFSVWDRWGKRVFTTSEPKEGWNGRINGVDSPAGGYLWEASIVNARGETEKFKGSVVLLR